MDNISDDKAAGYVELHIISSPQVDHTAMQDADAIDETAVDEIEETAELESWDSVKSIYHVALLDYYLVLMAKLPSLATVEGQKTQKILQDIEHPFSEFVTLDLRTVVWLNRSYRVLLFFAALFSQIVLPIAFLNQWITDAGAYHNFNTIVRPQNGPPDTYTQISQGVVGESSEYLAKSGILWGGETLECSALHSLPSSPSLSHQVTDLILTVRNTPSGCFVVFSTAMENWESLRFSTRFISSRAAGHLIPILLFYTLYLVVEFILFVAFMLILRSETPIDAVLNGVGILCVLDIDRLLSLPLSKMEESLLRGAVKAEGSKAPSVWTRRLLNASRIVLLMAKVAYWLWFLVQIRINGLSSYEASTSDPFGDLVGPVAEP